MANRPKIRRSLVKAVPAVTDIDDSELAYSFVSNQLFVKNPVTGAIDVIGGKTIVDSVNQINKPPLVQPLNFTEILTHLTSSTLLL